MIGKRRKQERFHRSPHLNAQKQSVFHYSSNRSQAEQERPRHAAATEATPKISRLKQVLTSLPYVVGATVALLIGVSLSTLSSSPKVVITGGAQSIRDAADYNKTARALTEGGFTKFTLNRQKLTDGMNAAYPELTNISVKTPLFARRAIVQADMAQPSVILHTDRSYLLDTQGVVLFDLEETRTSVNIDDLLVINDQSGTPIEVGKPALTSVQVMYALEIHHQAQAKQLNTESAELTAGGGELHFRFEGLPYVIKFSVYEDARRSFGTFIASKEHEVKPSEYIDVRVAERAYVK